MQNAETNILIAVPVFAGLLQYKCANSLIQLDRLLREREIQSTIRFISNDALVPRVRNQFANIAMFDTDSAGRKFSDLLFIDADIAFDPLNVITMLNADKPICGLPYAKKAINWQQVAAAVRRGALPADLPQFAGEACINADKPFSLNDVSPIRNTGTGAMLIKVEVLKALADKFPERKYEMCAAEKQFRGTEQTEAVDFFKVGVYPGTQHYLSEDFYFIEDARHAGFETYIVPFAQTVHTGTYDYTVNLRAVAAL